MERPPFLTARDSWREYKAYQEYSRSRSWPRKLCKACKTVRLTRTKIAGNVGKLGQAVMLLSREDGMAYHTLYQIASQSLTCRLCALLFRSSILPHEGRGPMLNIPLRIELSTATDSILATHRAIYAPFEPGGEGDWLYVGGRSIQMKGPCDRFTLDVEVYDEFLREAEVSLKVTNQMESHSVSSSASQESYLNPIPPLHVSQSISVSWWLKDCDQNHPRCQLQGVPPLPTRVIDIDSRSEPYLLETLGSSGNYTTLSYCWGQDAAYQPLKTTLANYKSRVKEIPLCTFPNTLQEAVKITKGLGIKYIWIDALCIIQHPGNEDVDGLTSHFVDWGLESVKMGHYYGNSFLTLSSLDGTNSHASILFERNQQPSFRFPGSSISIAPSRPSWGSIMRNAKLSSRAWAFQERLLSRRVLHFSRSELLWECRTCSRRESGEATCKTSKELTAIFQNNALKGLEHDFWKQILSSLNMENALSTWRQIVCLYSSRLIAHQSDRLVALSGVAEMFQTIGSFSYIAGLWKEDLVGLLWRRSTRLGSSGVTKNRDEYVAPSWSWASIPSGVGYMGFVVNPSRGNVQNARIISSKMIGDDQILDEISFPLGNIRPGSSITLRCYAVNYWSFWVPDYGGHLAAQTIKDGIEWDWEGLDYQEDCLALLIGIGIPRLGAKLEFAHFLVVQPATGDKYADPEGKEERWERVGFGSSIIASGTGNNKNLGIFNESKRRDIILV